MSVFLPFSLLAIKRRSAKSVAAALSAAFKVVGSSKTGGLSVGSPDAVGGLGEGFCGVSFGVIPSIKSVASIELHPKKLIAIAQRRSALINERVIFFILFSFR